MIYVQNKTRHYSQKVWSACFIKKCVNSGKPAASVYLINWINSAFDRQHSPLSTSPLMLLLGGPRFDRQIDPVPPFKHELFLFVMSL